MVLPLALLLFFGDPESTPEALLQTLSQGSPKERRDARKNLQRLGFEARGAVKKALASPDPQVAAAAQELWSELKWQIAPGFDAKNYRDALARDEKSGEDAWAALAEKSPLLFARLLALCGDELRPPAEDEENEIWNRLQNLCEVASSACQAPAVLDGLDEAELATLAMLSREENRLFQIALHIRRGELELAAEALSGEAALLDARLKDAVLMEKMGRLPSPAAQAIHLLSLRHKGSAFQEALAKRPDAWLGLAPAALSELLCRELMWPAEALAAPDEAAARRLAAPSQTQLLRLLPEKPQGFAALCRLQILRHNGHGRPEDWQNLHLSDGEIYFSLLDPWLAPSDIPVCDAYDFGIMKLAALDWESEFCRVPGIPSGELEQIRDACPPAAAGRRDALRLAQLKNDKTAAQKAALELAASAPDFPLALCLAADQFPPGHPDNHRLLLQAARKCRFAIEGEVLSGSIAIGRSTEAARVLLGKFTRLQNGRGDSSLSDPTPLHLLLGEAPLFNPAFASLDAALAPPSLTPEKITPLLSQSPVPIHPESLAQALRRQPAPRPKSLEEIGNRLRSRLASLPLDAQGRDSHLAWSWTEAGIEALASGHKEAAKGWLELSRRNLDPESEVLVIAEHALRLFDPAKTEPKP
ncbi:MAG: hypothetical protein RL095_954 [Verrucomicrobiota bacterium]|jgi:hypothetical protein